MLLPASPFDLWPFFWRVPAHTKRRANPFATLFEFTGTEGDDRLRDALAKAHLRGSAPSRKHIDRLVRLVVHRSDVDPRVLAIVMMAKSSSIAEGDLSATTWPQSIDGLKAGLSMSSALPRPLANILDQMISYSVLADEFREAALAHDVQRCRELINTAPFVGTATADFVRRHLDTTNDPGTAIHVMGLLFPLTMVDLLARAAPYSDGDIFEFAPALDQRRKVVRPMRLMMDRLHAATGCNSQEGTFRTLFLKSDQVDKIDAGDTRLLALYERGWSYRAISPKERTVPRWRKFGEVIDTVSSHRPNKAPQFERLRGRFWQVCLYENLLSLCEELQTRVPDIDPLMVFQDIDILKARHSVTAARTGP